MYGTRGFEPHGMTFLFKFAIVLHNAWVNMYD